MFAAEIYSARRARLADAGLSGLVVLLGNVDAPMNYAHNPYHFVQDGSFRYFFGLDMQGLAGVLDLDLGEVALYGDEPEVADIVWTGPLPALSARAADVGVGLTRPYAQLATAIQAAQAAGRPVHYLQPYRGETVLELARLLKCSSDAIKPGFSVALTHAVVALREIKQDVEIAEMEAALAVTREMHIAAMRAARPGTFEYQAVGAMEGIMRSQDLRLAYPSIFSRRGEVLHNEHYKGQLQAGDLALNDTGCTSAGGYASDITRTIPVGGRFSDSQRAIYEIVLEMQESAIAALRPGVRYLDMHKLAARVMVERMTALGFFHGDAAEIVESGAYAIAFPHGLGHQIGLDVHDMEALGEDLVGYGEGLARSPLFGLGYLRLAKSLKAGMVLTVEPGIYFIPALIEAWQAEGRHAGLINYARFLEYRDFGGIRLEDNVLITADGSRILGEHIPKTVAEVEAVMAA